MTERSVIQQETVPRNTGASYEVQKGEVIRISGSSIADIVAFSPDFDEQFDQARTKVYNQTIFLSVGDALMTKSNKRMFEIVEDSFGLHDLQHGMCSAPRFELAAKEGKIEDYYFREIPPEEMPDHGCWENLQDALEQYEVDPEEIPSPLNLFQTITIDPETGDFLNTDDRPDGAANVDLKAEMDAVVAVSSCPDLWAGGSQGHEITIFDTAE
jgi:uncharacterized protein YcgI (DUF1989 family)